MITYLAFAVVFIIVATIAYRGHCERMNNIQQRIRMNGYARDGGDADDPDEYSHSETSPLGMLEARNRASGYNGDFWDGPVGGASE